jgi:septal ring factor EnvC (AmiA/AmiB activator)
MEIECVVVEEVRALGRDEALLAQVLADAHAAIQAEHVALRRDRDDLAAERKRNHRELRELAAAGTTTAETTSRMADLQERLLDADRRLPELEKRLAELEGETVSCAEAQAAFAEFDGVWTSLTPQEQARLLRLLLSKVEYDGDAGTVSVTFRPSSIRSLINRKLENAA